MFKSITPKDNTRAFTSFGTDESAGSTIDNRGRAKVNSKVNKSANPSLNSVIIFSVNRFPNTKKSPQPKTSKSAVRISTLESPGNKNENQVLM